MKMLSGSSHSNLSLIHTQVTVKPSRKQTHSKGQRGIVGSAVYYTGTSKAVSSLIRDSNQLLWKPYMP